MLVISRCWRPMKTNDDIEVGSFHTYKNQNSRRFIIIHHINYSDPRFKAHLLKHVQQTGIKGTLKYLSDMTKSDDYGRVSYHKICDRDGQGYSLVPEEFDCWGAGKSSAVDHPISSRKAKRVYNLNDQSIQLALVGDGNAFNFESAQYDWEAKTCAELIRKYNIDPRRILGHEDVATPLGRKTDPGPRHHWGLLFSKIYKELELT